MSMDYQSPLRLKLDKQALLSNYRWLRHMSGSAACGAAIKANGYGMGDKGVLAHLAAEGCRNFFVATWQEAQHVEPGIADTFSLSVFHGVRPEDMEIALASRARPVLNSAVQIARWKEANGGPCDVMIDTGMNRLGLSLDGLDMTLFDGLEIETLMSHLVSAEDDHHLNDIQLMLFRDIAAKVKAKRFSLANSAGICRGADFAFDLTRPGIALYGGTPTLDCELNIQAVVTPQAEILQRRTVRGGDSVGYGGDFVADRTMETATINIGYADGFARIFSGSGAALKDGARLPVIGRVSMDLVTIDVNECPDLKEGDWVDIDYDLGYTALVSGLSQYELLTRLGHRFERYWV
ncbi:MAG: alanine racemase [Sphingobium sp.]|nr:alanine racemase [Sphingobium sp.]MBP6112785.1 alanine racemase [Sphingobium sp.]MBP8669963.1 alanine racemase [Sphingobium sp.]MBP9158325.1 alanine racemase [Sphingobium sp.]MCC6482154.1 alanine racemase [Sphingomonadaceae bacterium]